MATRIAAGTRLHIQPREGKLRLEVQPEGYTWLSFWFDDIPELRDMLAAAVRHKRMPRQAADDALAHAREWVGSYEDDDVGASYDWQVPSVRPTFRSAWYTARAMLTFAVICMVAFVVMWVMESLHDYIN